MGWSQIDLSSLPWRTICAGDHSSHMAANPKMCKVWKVAIPEQSHTWRRAHHNSFQETCIWCTSNFEFPAHPKTIGTPWKRIALLASATHQESNVERRNRMANLDTCSKFSNSLAGHGAARNPSCQGLECRETPFAGDALCSPTFARHAESRFRPTGLLALSSALLKQKRTLRLS